MPEEPRIDFALVIAGLEALPEAGEGMTVAEIAARVDADPSTVVAALEEIVECEERAPPEKER